MSVVPSAATEAALSFEQVTCTFISNDDPKQRYTAVQDVTMTIAPGEFVSVVGPTGCGKSTLLNVGAGLLAPSSGVVRVFGQTLDARTQGVNKRSGYMFQAEALMPWRSALANVTAGLEFRGVSSQEAIARGKDWLERVGLAGFEDRYPHQLSGGMRKRVALAQVLVLDPDIILMDEPFSALDIQTRQLMENEVLDIWQSQRKAVAVHHARPRRGDRDVGPRDRVVRRPREPDRSPSSRSTSRVRATSRRSATTSVSPRSTRGSGPR